MHGQGGFANAPLLIQHGEDHGTSDTQRGGRSGLPWLREAVLLCCLFSVVLYFCRSV
jgi:hypothetical protein